MPKYCCVVAEYAQGEDFIRSSGAGKPLADGGDFLLIREVKAKNPQAAFDFIETEVGLESPRFIAVYPALPEAEQSLRKEKPLAEWGEPLVKWSLWEEKTWFDREGS